MLVHDFNLSTATTTIIVEFPMQPINACYADSLQDHLFEAVLFDRGFPEEYLYVGSDFMPISNVADVIRYQFGDLYEVEYSSAEIANLLQLETDVWVNNMGGYDKVKA